MAYNLKIDATTRNNMLDAITTRAGNAALLRIYDGTQPSTGGAATTLLAELTCASPLAPGAAAGVLTMSAITQDSSANATATATWFRLVKSDGTTHVLDGSAGTATTDLVLNTTSLVTGGPVAVTSWTITAGNA